MKKTGFDNGAKEAGGGGSKQQAGGSSMSLVLRIRTQVGTWRVGNVMPSDTIATLKRRIESEHRADLEGRPLTRDPAGSDRFRESDTVGQPGLENGAMLYAMVDESKCGIHENSSGARAITKEGNIVAQQYSDAADSKGFRPGMMPLRNMKMQWTLNEFVALDAQFEFKVQKQEAPFCTGATLENTVFREFHEYMLGNFDYQCMRVGFLYGTFQEDNSVVVDFMYEPPQSTTDTSFELLEDPRIETVEALAAMLGRRRVGWTFAHPMREDGFFLSGREVIEAAEQQVVAAGDIAETPFVTVRVTVNAKNETVVDAIQVSKQCMEMAAEQVLQVSSNLGMCAINQTFTAVVELKGGAQKTNHRGKEVNEVETAAFISGTGVPVKNHNSDVFVSSLFPRCNRAIMQAGEDLKRHLSKVGQKGWTLLDLLSDFHLLLYLATCGALSMEDDMRPLCQCIVDRKPIGEGHTLLIRSLAGLDT